MTTEKAVRRLTKAHAVRLVDAIDTPSLRHEVLTAIAWSIGQTWSVEASADPVLASELLQSAAERGQWAPETRAAVLAGDVDALTDLAILLSELRTVERPG